MNRSRSIPLILQHCIRCREGYAKALACGPNISRGLTQVQSAALHDARPARTYDRDARPRQPAQESADTFGTLNSGFRQRPQPQPKPVRRLKAPRVDAEMVPLVLERPIAGGEKPEGKRPLEEEDVFGTITNPEWEKLQRSVENDEGLKEETVPFRQRPYWYLLQLRKLLRQHNLRDALEFFEVRMRGEDKARPLRAVYNMMIAACGRAGYITKAFQFYGDMKRYRFDPDDGTFVGLFNACAECPDQKNGLLKARELRADLQLTAHTPNQIVYHSMIKAFGRGGDLAAAFQLADEMASNQIEMDARTFSFLLMGCISNEESGFKHAVEVWRFMIKAGIKPDLFHYSLLLRSIRDCGLGPTGFANELLPPHVREPSNPANTSLVTKPHNTLPEYMRVDRSKMLPPPEISITNQIHFEKYSKEASSQEQVLAGDVLDHTDKHRLDTTGLYQSITRDLLAEDSSKKMALKRGEWWESPKTHDLLSGKGLSASYGLVLKGDSAIPDLLLPFESQGNTSVVAIGHAMNPAERLELLGGYSAILSRMQRDRVNPDRKLLTVLIEILPSDAEAEMKIVELGGRVGAKLDVDFYNILIWKRCVRGDFAGAMEIWKYLESQGLHASERTFKSLAYGVNTIPLARKFFEEMEKRHVEMNVKIMKTLICRACAARDPGYLLFLMKKMGELKIAPNAEILEIIEKWKTDTQKAIIESEKSREPDETYSKQYFKEGWKFFKSTYDKWLARQPAPVEPDPFAAFQYNKKPSQRNDGEEFEQWRKGRIYIDHYSQEEVARPRVRRTFPSAL